MNSSSTHIFDRLPGLQVDPSLRLPTVLAVLGISRAKVYADIAADLFPDPVKKGRSSFWPASEVAAVNAARIASKSDDEIRALVKRLMAARQHALEDSL